METKYWEDIKEGDIYRLPVISPDWLRVVGYQVPPGFLLISKGSYTCHYHLCDKKTDKYFRNNFSLPKESQIVEILSPEDIRCGAVLLGSMYQKANEYTGADPEIFVVRGKEGKSILPAFQYLRTKEKEKDGVYDSSGAFTYHPVTMAYAYRDGFAAEFFVNPTTCHGYLIDFIRAGLKTVLSKAIAFDRTSDLTIENTVTIPEVTMQAASDEDVALGCNTSLNAYDNIPEIPADARVFRTRSAGGHIHFSIPTSFREHIPEMVRSCDITAAIPAVAIFAAIDKPARREFYGRAGEYRTPSYGLEYRVLSNAWLCAPEVAHLMLNLTRAGTRVGRNNLRKYFEISEEEVQEIINFCDFEQARRFVEKNRLLYEALLSVEGLHKNKVDVASVFQKVVQEGVEAVVPSYDKITKNWGLSREWGGHSDNSEKTWIRLCERLKNKSIKQSATPVTLPYAPITDSDQPIW